MWRLGRTLYNAGRARVASSAFVAAPWPDRGKIAFWLVARAVNYGCAAHLFLTYVGGPVHMAGPSMMPTMSAAGEICIESTLAHRLRADAPARGALVTFTSPLDPGRLVCKRVLGLPGDVVCVDPLGARAPSAQHVVVPRGHLWLVGDNAAASRDSRTYGPVSMALVRGRLVARIWPLKDFTIFRDNMNYID